MTISDQQIGQRLREARQDRGLTQRELADQIFVAELTYWRIENGRRPIRATELIAIAEALQVSLEEFFASGGN